MLRQGRENVHLAKLVCVCVRVRARHKEHCDCYDHLEDWCPRFVKGVLLVNFSYHCVREQIFFSLNIPSTFSLLPSVPTCSKGKTEKKRTFFLVLSAYLFCLELFTVAFLSFGGGALERFVAAGSE